MTVVNPGGGGGSATITGTFQGTAAARPAPAAAPAGALYFATDTGEYSLNNLGQSAWQLLARTSAPTFLVNDGTHIVALGAADNGVDVLTLGAGLSVKEGSNAKQGLTAAMTSGAVTTANTSVTANSRILYCQQSGTLTGFVTCTRVAGTSFTLTSSVGTDTAAFAYQIFEPG